MNNVDDLCQIEVVDHLRESLSAHEKCARRSVRWVKLVGVLNLGNYYLPHTLWCSVDGFLFGNIPERCILSMMAQVGSTVRSAGEPTRNCAYLQKAVQTGANQKQAEWSMPWPWRWRFDR